MAHDIGADIGDVFYLLDVAIPCSSYSRVSFREWGFALSLLYGIIMPPPPHLNLLIKCVTVLAIFPSPFPKPGVLHSVSPLAIF